MAFYILGALEYFVGDDRVDLGGLRQQVVLAVLLLEANRAVRTPRLMEALYGEALPSSSRAQVQICISSLRRLFATTGFPDAIATRPQGYALQVPGQSIDLFRYEAGLAQGREMRDRGRTAEAVGQFRAALGLWRGPALDGIESQVVRSAADRLADRKLTAHEECLELELGLGRHHQIVDELRDMVEENPLRERLRGQLMLALYRSDRQAEALETYRGGRNRLIEELGLEPNEKLQELERFILTSDPRLLLPEQVRAAPPVTGPGIIPVPLPVEADDEAEAEAAPVPVPSAPPAQTADTDIPTVQTVQTVPRLLPTDIADFTGRAVQIDTIEQQFALAADDPERFAVPVVVMAGKPGIGKTTLAVHASHRLADRYPDGQLYADLHGRHTDQVAPAQVLERFLRALGVPGTTVPEGLEERAELYRALLSDRRMLVVLDNAGGEGQVRPLLPGTSLSGVLVTSRARLAGLPGAVHVDIDVFDPQQSVELLARIAGADRVEAEPEAAAQLAELCGHLPLALRIAGARLAARPQWSVDDLVERLENEARRLDELNHSGMGIRASISLTYDHLEEGARRLLRLLTVPNMPHFSAWVAAALLDEPFTVARDLLDDLADAQLIETTDDGRGVHAHYRFHDLIRVFARERLMADEATAEREAALRRVLGCLCFLVDEVNKRSANGYVPSRIEEDVYPVPDRQLRQLLESPMAWFERERMTIVSAVGQAAQTGLVTQCWGLAIIAVTLFESRAYMSDWRETTQIALAAAEQAGDRFGQAAMLYSAGNLLVSEQRFQEARSRLIAAGEIFETCGDDRAMALVNRHLGIIERHTGDLATAAARFGQALDTERRFQDWGGVAYLLQQLAQIRLEDGDVAGALQLLPEALDCARRGGHLRTEAQVLHRLGESHRQAGNLDQAVDVLRQGLVVVRELGDEVGQAYVLHGLGMSLLRLRRLVEAEECMQEALRLACENREQLIEARASIGLGEFALAMGSPSQAILHLHRALGLFRALHTKAYEERALALLNDAYQAIQNGAEKELADRPTRTREPAF